MTYVIAEPCVDVKDGACVRVCPVDCIYEGGRMFYIHPDECIDCGICLSVCPVEAIFEDSHVPSHWQPYIAANREFFGDQVTGWGSTGGLSDSYATTQDHPLVEGLPQRG